MTRSKEVRDQLQANNSALIRKLKQENPDLWTPILEEDLDFAPKPSGSHTNPITPTSLGTGLSRQQKSPRDLRVHE